MQDYKEMQVNKSVQNKLHVLQDIRDITMLKHDFKLDKKKKTKRQPALLKKYRKPVKK
jgi:hypothetical protein